MEDDDLSDAFLVFYFAFYIAPRCGWTWSYNDDVIIGVHIASRENLFLWYGIDKQTRDKI